MGKQSLSMFRIWRTFKRVKKALPQKPTVDNSLYRFPANIETRYRNADDRSVIILELAQHMSFFLGLLTSIDIRLVNDDPSSTSFNFKVNKKGQASEKVNYAFAGQYQQSTSRKHIITIANEQQYAFDNLAAIIAHECTHEYLNVHNINNMGIDNELLTDIMAVFLGFGTVMLRGYEGYGYSIGYINNPTINNALLCTILLRKWSPFSVLSQIDDKVATILNWLTPT
jgi:hypothetical protein